MELDGEVRGRKTKGKTTHGKTARGASSPGRMRRGEIGRLKRTHRQLEKDEGDQ